MNDSASHALKREDFFLSWYSENGRDFPWRGPDVKPFQILVTEMLLRQTQAVQVERLWQDFMNQFGDPKSLAAARDEEVFGLVKELGFGNQRTNALKLAASYVLESHCGEVPSKTKELLNIPHIGIYSAQAVRCFAFEEIVPIVDTNILRLFCRILGKQIKRPDVRREDWAWSEAESILPEKGDLAVKHNYGLLDFTAQVCTSRSPVCKSCPLSRNCEYGLVLLEGEKPTSPW